MKKTGTLLLILAFTGILFAQEAAQADSLKQKAEAIEEVNAHIDTTVVLGRLEVVEETDRTRVSLGKNEVIIVEENGDTVIVGLGDKGVSIVEDDDGVIITVLDMKDRKQKKYTKKRSKRFDAHWAGFELGLNNYLTPDYSLVMPAGEEFMDLNTGRSWNWNLNIADFGIPLGTSYVGIVSGLGFEFINYNFDGQNSIEKETDTRQIIEYTLPDTWSISNSKMNITYATIPLLLEFQIPAGKYNRIHLSAGVIGGMKLWSNTKVKYREDGDKSNAKVKGDYNLSPFRWGFTARVGYEEVSVFATYYMTSLFEDGMGPELHPFSVGIALAL